MIENQPLELPKFFTLKGNFHSQILGEKPYYIYSVSKEGIVKGYEVFISSISKEWVVGGNVVPSKWSYPGDNSFGKTAWYCNSKERAFEKLQEIKNKKLDSQNRKDNPVIKETKIIDLNRVKGKCGRKAVYKNCTVKNCQNQLMTGEFQKFKGFCKNHR